VYLVLYTLCLVLSTLLPAGLMFFCAVVFHCLSRVLIMCGVVAGGVNTHEQTRPSCVVTCEMTRLGKEPQCKQTCPGKEPSHKTRSPNRKPSQPSDNSISACRLLSPTFADGTVETGATKETWRLQNKRQRIKKQATQWHPLEHPVRHEDPSATKKRAQSGW
jgi:hypothetical protein